MGGWERDGGREGGRGRLGYWRVGAETLYYGPRPLKSTRRHGHFLKSTCDMGPIDREEIINDMTYAIS